VPVQASLSGAPHTYLVVPGSTIGGPAATGVDPLVEPTLADGPGRDYLFLVSRPSALR
jgi:hypothetical protein